MTIPAMDEKLLVSLARRFDPRIIYPDRLAEACFTRFCQEWGLVLARVLDIKRKADWRHEDIWVFAEPEPVVASKEGDA